ncbi:MULTISPECIES: sulfatase family protein [Aestuariivivens]|uniref:sulfatase family protein n=1 Tax=Aestuariivivens TaxID=1820275 RepID=UPI001F560B15|nr:MULTISPECIES: sulfatase [Aestuariivivens]
MSIKERIRVVLMVIILFPSILFAQNKSEERPPNIFFFFADDWGEYASVYNSFPPNQSFRTPTIDQFAKKGVIFNNAHVTSPSCTPSRSSLLSGQYFYRTGTGAILTGAKWDSNIPSYPLLLRDAGYHIGYTYKVWSPGTPKDAPYGGKKYEYANAGRRFNNFSQNVTKMVARGKLIDEAKTEIYKEVIQNFRDFIADRKDNKSFCYWFGPTNTHRKWVKGSGKMLWGLEPDSLKGKMPEFLPDVHVVREDMTDYLGEVLALDAVLELFLKELEVMGERENTIIVISGDHGIPGMPRGKCNLYPFGTKVPLLVQWPGHAPAGRYVDDFINLMDLAPTFLELADQPIPECMTGKSIVSLLQSDKSGLIDSTRDYVIVGRERHVAKAREGNLPYPQRAISTKDFLYIINFAPDREPMGTPFGLDGTGSEPSFAELENNTSVSYSDLDASPTKAWMIKNRKQKEWEMHWLLGFGKRPMEELYDLRKDPDYLYNVADKIEYADVQKKLHKRLIDNLKATGDPRVSGDGQTFEKPPFVEK